MRSLRLIRFARFVAAGCFLLIVALAACGADENTPTTQQTEQPPPTWMGEKPSDWPQIVLANHIVFKDQQVLTGASCFLMRLPDGVIVGCTAKHVLGEGIKLDTLNSTLKSWTMYPRTHEQNQTTMQQLALDPAIAGERDWAVVIAADQNGPWPAEVLPARQTSVEPGEAVYLLGVPYSEKSAQNVYAGTVSKRRVGTEEFEFQIDTTFETRGLSGAPIIDSQGRLAAIYIAHLDKQPVAGKLTLVGVDTSSILPAIKLPGDFKPPAQRVVVPPKSLPNKVAAMQPAANAPARQPASRATVDPEADAASMLRSAQMFYDHQMYAAAEAKLKKLLDEYPTAHVADQASALLKQVKDAEPAP